MDEEIVQLVEARLAVDPVVIAGAGLRQRQLLRAHALQEELAAVPVAQQPVLEAIAGAQFHPVVRFHAGRVGRDLVDGAREIARLRRLVDVGDGIGKARAAGGDVRQRSVHAAQHHPVRRLVDRIDPRGQAQRRDGAEHMRVRFEKAHAAGFGDQMRGLREGIGMQPPADALARLEQADAQLRLHLPQPPGGIDARNAATDDGDVEVGRARGARDQRGGGKGRTSGKNVAAIELHRHTGGLASLARRSR